MWLDWWTCRWGQQIWAACRDTQSLDQAAVQGWQWNSMRPAIEPSIRLETGISWWNCFRRSKWFMYFMYILLLMIDEYWWFNIDDWWFMNIDWWILINHWPYLLGGFKHFFIFHNIWDNPSHWLVFFKMVKTTNQIFNGLVQGKIYRKPSIFPLNLQETIDDYWSILMSHLVNPEIPLARFIPGMIFRNITTWHSFYLSVNQHPHTDI